MAWTPQFKVLNARAIPDNLHAFFLANQAGALVWAGDGSLKPIEAISATVANRSEPKLPAIAFADDNDAADYGDSLIGGGYAVTFEFMVQNASPDEAVRQARIYHKAFASMIANCPQATLLANVGATKAILDSLESGFDEIKGNKTRTDFMQRFTVRATFILQASIFEQG